MQKKLIVKKFNMNICTPIEYEVKLLRYKEGINTI